MKINCLNIGEAKLQWTRFERHAVMTPYQQYSWLKPWCEHVADHLKVEPLIIIGRKPSDSIAFIWPFMLEREFGLTLCRWLGGKIQNLNGGLYDRDWIEIAGPDVIKSCLDQVLALRPDIDLFDLTLQPLTIGGYDNPFSKLEGLRQSVHPIYTLQVEGSFDEYLRDRTSSQSRKKDKKRRRGLERQLGPISFVKPQGADEITATLDLLHEFVDQRFSNLGIRNVFKPDGMYQFMRTVCLNNTLKLREFKAADDVLNIIGNLEQSGHQSGFITGMCEGETGVRFSPGRLAMLEEIGEAFQNSVHTLDVGIGREPYKLAWFDQAPLYDWGQAANFCAATYLLFLRGIRRAKRSIRNNDRIWSFAKHFRKRLFGRK